MHVVHDYLGSNFANLSDYWRMVSQFMDSNAI